MVTDADGAESMLEADAVLIATGASPRVLPTAQPDGERILSWDQVYDLDELPTELIVVGSGVTGAEFASAYLALGVPVTLVSSRDRVLPGEVIHSDCGSWSAPLIPFGTKRGTLYRLEVTRPAVVTKSLTRCGCPNHSEVCGAYDPSSDQPLWVLPEGVKYGGVLEIEAPQKVLDIKLNVSPRCPDPPA